MKFFAGKVASLIGVIANFILFVVALVSFLFILFSGETMQNIVDNLTSPLLWICGVLSVVCVAFALVISIVACIKLILGQRLNKIFYCLIVLLSLLIIDGVLVFGFSGISDANFGFFLGIYISYVVINGFLLTGCLLNNPKSNI